MMPIEHMGCKNENVCSSYRTIGDISKVMIYESKNGVYVILFETHENKGANADYCYETLGEAMDFCNKELNIVEEQWFVINDPKDGEQHDIIY
ncbi:hypothetical protein MHH52_16735 [Paenibacillus sp. FSL K6-0276]|uniref:hypothetical protein n=1 Tax=Paenibacillus sp. FSL K6-0276 TaxID=2921450 RepID=UPI0030EF7B20